jgi:hypothetical protein
MDIAAIIPIEEVGSAHPTGFHAVPTQAEPPKF